MKLARALTASLFALFLIVGPLSGQNLNPVGTYVNNNRSSIRGYKCENWINLSREERVAFLLGVVSMQDLVEERWGNSLGPVEVQQFTLTRSATQYTQSVDQGCTRVPGDTPVLAVLYWVK
jgi:hypothetical protein